MELFCGIDFGSSNTKVVLFEKNSNSFFKGISKTRADYVKAFEEAFKIAHYRFYKKYKSSYKILRNCVTGYGRIRLPFKNIESEIACHTFAVRYFFPNTKTILDLGGQDFKAISINEDGKIKSFQMNDRCAAGCGRHIEYIAKALRLKLSDLSKLAFSSRKKLSLNTDCAVFAGGEAMELFFMGEKKVDIIAALLEGISSKALSLLKRNSEISYELTLTGGVSMNHFIVEKIKKVIGEVNVFPFPYFSGAIGAALVSAYDLNKFDKLLSSMIKDVYEGVIHCSL